MMKSALLPLSLLVGLSGCSLNDMDAGYEPPPHGGHQGGHHGGHHGGGQGDQGQGGYGGGMGGGQGQGGYGGGMGQQGRNVTLSGTVNYRERIALPPGARVSVSVEDVSLADAPSRTIASTQFQAQGGVPIPFTLTYDADRIERGRTYTVSARIEDANGRQLLFITDTRNALPRRGQSIDLWLVSARGGRR